MYLLWSIRSGCQDTEPEQCCHSIQGQHGLALPLVGFTPSCDLQGLNVAVPNKPVYQRPVQITFTCKGKILL